MERFLKGILVGLGGVAPGLSGSVLLIIFGLYRQTLDALGTLLKDLKRKLRFLLPLVAGMGVGVLLFSKLLHFLLLHYEMPTRFCFLGLILGTLPMVWREVKKEGFPKPYYLLIVLSAGLSFWFFTADPNAFPQVTAPSLMQSVLLGVAVALTAIVPGVDPAVFLSTLGLYEMYVAALANVTLSILLPMAVGLAIGAVVISFAMSWLFQHCYTGTYSVIFGIFLSMIPNMLNSQCRLGRNISSLVAVVLMAAGVFLSWWLGSLEQRKQKDR